MMKLTRFTLLLSTIALSGLGGCSDDKPSTKDKHDDHGDEKGHEDGHEGEEGHEGEGEHEGEDEHGGVIELPEKVAASAKISVAKAEKRQLAAEIAATGTIGFDETRLAHVSPRVPGRVSRVLAKLGDEVKKGQSLVVLDSMELGRAKADHLRAKAQLDVARTEYEREQRLAEKKIASQKDLQDAQAAFRQATAGVQATTQVLRLLGLSSSSIGRLSYDKSSSAYLTLRAPLKGRVVEKHATIGELATPETKIYTVADLSNLWVLVDVYERDLRRIHLDDTARVRADAYPGQDFEGKVSYIEDRIDTHTRTVKARIEVSNEHKKLRPGMFVRVILSDPHAVDGETQVTAAIVVPSVAVQRDGDERVVFVKTGERHYERREVEVGRVAADVVEITKGVAAGESVAVSGTFILKSEAAKESMGGGHSH